MRNRLVRNHPGAGQADRGDPRRRAQGVAPTHPSPEARQALLDGALLVDIHPAAQRAAEGAIPEALVVERNVLEWRFDPRSDARLPIAAYDLQVIVVCSAGYTSGLAAASLQQVGLPALPMSSAGSTHGAPAVSP
jgi:rhodanese-related sulfurtransferase